jgi:hypothetical protein
MNERKPKHNDATSTRTPEIWLPTSTSASSFFCRAECERLER